MAKDQSSSSSTVVIFMTALDTTWRMFTPIIAGTFLGIWIDKQIGSAPYATIGCLLLGVAVCVVLIIQQFKQVRKSKN